MTKQYAAASPDSDLGRRISRVQREYHPDLDGVSIRALFAFTDEDEPCLTHQGYGAAAVIKIVGLKDRAAGLADVMLVVDRYVYEELTNPQRDALVDHELYHLVRVVDSKTDKPVFDSLGRPKLAMRLHDWQLGGFDEIADRHGDAALEIAQARTMLRGQRQLFLALGGRREDPDEPPPSDDNDDPDADELLGRDAA